MISTLLQLIEDEQKKQGRSPLKSTSDALSVQVAACIVALCGWTGRLDKAHNLLFIDKKFRDEHCNIRKIPHITLTRLWHLKAFIELASPCRKVKNILLS